MIAVALRREELSETGTSALLEDDCCMLPHLEDGLLSIVPPHLLELAEPGPETCGGFVEKAAASSRRRFDIAETASSMRKRKGMATGSSQD